MNYITFRNRNESLMILYMDFLPYCASFNDKLKLIDEIQRLKNIVLSIDSMPVAFAKNEMTEYYKIFESINNTM